MNTGSTETERVYAADVQEGDEIEWVDGFVPVLEVQHIAGGQRTGRGARGHSRPGVKLKIRTALDERRCHWWADEVVTRRVKA